MPRSRRVVPALATDLPIEAVLPELTAALRARTEAVLEAPTGAGKTTRVPLALLDAPWMQPDKRLVVLEPRRLAARAAAHRMAHLLGEKVGQTVGYRVRMDTRVSAATRIEVVTEGVFTRMVQGDPELAGIGGVVFDEFHERSLPADLGLALALEAQGVLRPDLRLLVMSATLDAGPIAALLGDAPRIVSEGRTYPVDVRYLRHRPEGRLEDTVAAQVRDALAGEPGDVLVFLPGAGEIRRTEERLTGTVPAGVDLRPLFGNMPHREQDAAIAPSPDGRRKVVLATPIAETSLTIEGVRVVVDGGYRRAPRFDAATGMTRLVTVRIAQAAADQRAGRAGRTAPGVCYRLWTRATQHRLASHAPPAIVKADLAPLALELAVWGAGDPAALRWLDPPPATTYAEARTLLRRLDALDADGRVTDHGRRMADLGLHPRLAHMILHGDLLGHGALACDLAALLSDRDVLKGRGRAPDADLRLRLEALAALRDDARPTPRTMQGMQVDRSGLHRARQMADHWRRTLGVPPDARPDASAAGLLAAFAYPDRLAQALPGDGDRFRLRSGPPATLSHPQLLSDADLLAVAHLDGHGRETRVALAAPLTDDDVRTYFGEQIETVERVRWDAGAGRVTARVQDRLGALVLRDKPLADPDPEAVADVLTQAVRDEGLDMLPWTKRARRLQARLVFLHHHQDALPGTWPDVRDAALRATLGDWLRPHLYGRRRADDLARLSMTDLLLGHLDGWDQRQALDRLAPTHRTVPSGSKRPIDYSDPAAPVLAVRLQEMFGQTTTPRIAGGRVPLTLHLLSPAQRPVQVTQDLESFWATTYFEVRKDLRGRYSKHYWPEDPLRATPTHRAKPRR